MDKYSVLGIITLIVVFISFLFAFFLITVKSRNKVSNILIAIYFTIIAVHISVFFYSEHIVLPSVIERLRDQIMYLTSPLLFLYILSAIYSDFKLRWKHLLHLLPFLAAVTTYLPRFYLVEENKRLLFLSNFYEQPEVKFLLTLDVIVPIFYFILMLMALKKYKILLLENYTNDKNFNYKWLLSFVWFLILLFVIATFKNQYKMIGSVDTINILRIVFIISLLGFMSWIVLKSMYSPELFRNIDIKHRSVKKILANEQNTSKKPDEISDMVKSLRNYMEDEKPFLDPSLTINKLAGQMNIPCQDLSLLINHHMGQHFFNFVNEYRIKSAIELLKKPTNKKLTIIEIIYAVGFNSKSPFNREFKKFTGLTPTEYRKRIVKQMKM